MLKMPDKNRSFLVKHDISGQGNGISEVKQNNIRLADGTVIPTYTILDSWG